MADFRKSTLGGAVFTEKGGIAACIQLLARGEVINLEKDVAIALRLNQVGTGAAPYAARMVGLHLDAL